MPKKALLRPLVAAMDAGRLKVAKGLRETEAFQREFLAFQRRITESGNATFEGVGEHDDLVIAVAGDQVGPPANPRPSSDVSISRRDGLPCGWPPARERHGYH